MIIKCKLYLKGISQQIKWKDSNMKNILITDKIIKFSKRITS